MKHAKVFDMFSRVFQNMKFCRGVKHLKIFDICPGIYRNLDQGPDGDSKTVFPRYGENFGMDESRDLKF